MENPTRIRMMTGGAPICGHLHIAICSVDSNTSVTLLESGSTCVRYFSNFNTSIFCYQW